MKITKYEHACLVIEEGGEQLVIDPGVFTTSLPSLKNVVAVVVTHVHSDHIDKGNLEQILRDNPEAKIYSTSEVSQLLSEQPIEVVTDGTQATIGSFHLTFTGGKHAIIDISAPEFENIGVIVSDIFYYPGDSFTYVEGEFEAVAVPSIAPWAKVSESMDFIHSVDAKRYFPTHNALLSDAGQGIYNNWLERAAKAKGAEFIYLKPAESIKLYYRTNV